MKPYVDLHDSLRSWSLSEVKTNEGLDLIKVPIAFVGEWSHPEYGKVKFSPEDLSKMAENWQQARGGYDPPLFLGHPVNTDTVEGHPSEGWPDSIYLDGDTLYGEYVSTSGDLVEAVRNKRYRYASAEVLPSAVDKSTGEEIGPLLVGVALTNRPFLPMKERTLEVVTKFSDSSSEQLPYVFSFDLLNQQDAKMTTATVNQEVAGASAQPTGADNTATVPQQQFSDTKAQPTEAGQEGFVSKTDYLSLKQKYGELAEQFSSLAAEHSATQTKLSDLLEREKQREVEEKLAKLTKLNLPAERKELFCEMIKNGELPPSAEAKLFADLQNESEKYGHLFSEPRGQADESAANNNQPQLPQLYADIIARNEQIIKARQGL